MSPSETDVSSTSRRAAAPSSSLRRREFLVGTAGLTSLGTAGCLNVLDNEEGAEEPDSNLRATDGWPTYRGDWQRTGLAPADAGPGESLSIAWETSFLDVIEAREGVSARPRGVVDDDYDGYAATGVCSDVTLSDELAYCGMHYLLYQGETQESNWGGIVAMDAASGSVEWTVDGMSDYSVAPTVVEDRLYHFVFYPVADVEGPHVLVADAATGSVEARHELPTRHRDVPTITENGSYHRGPVVPPRGVAQVDPDGGDRDWLAEAPGPQARVKPFTVADGSVLYGSDGEGGREQGQRSIVALDAETGDEQWRWTFDVPERPDSLLRVFLGSPSVVDGNGYVAGRPPELGSDEFAGCALRSFEADGGDERWTFRPERVPYEELGSGGFPQCDTRGDCEDPPELAALEGTPLVVDDLVVVPGYGRAAPTGDSHTEHRHLYAVSADDGSPQWSIPGRASSAVAAGDVIYARLGGDRVAAISTDGTVLDAVERDEGAPWGRAPAIGHGRVYSSWGSDQDGTTASPDTVVAIE